MTVKARHSLADEGLPRPHLPGNPLGCGGSWAECLAPTLVTIVTLMLATTLSACSAGWTGTPAPVVLRIAGSTSLQPVLKELATAYQSAHPNVLIDVRGGGTAIGIQQLRDGQIDLAAVSWRSEDEKLPDNIQAIPVARDGIAVIVHPTNAITNLTSLQLHAIYRGEILDWAALGHTSSMPTVISREEGSGTRAAFETLVMGDERVTLNALVLPTGEAIIDYVASHRDAIGYTSSVALAGEGAAAPDSARVRVVPVEEVAPTPATLRAGAYRLGRVLHLYVATPTEAEARAFLDFVLSPAGQAIVARQLTPIR